MEILIKRLTEQAKLASYAHATDPGISLYAKESVTFEPGARVDVGTGIAMAIPVGYIGLVWHKEGVPSDSGVHAKAVVIDSGYRKEIIVQLINHTQAVVDINAGDRIAQMLIQKVEQPRLIEAEDLSEGVEDGE